MEAQENAMQRVDPISAVLRNDFIVSCETWEDYVNLGHVAREYKDKSQWFLGRLAMAVATKYGDNNLGKFAKEIGVDKKTLQNYRWVVSRYVGEEPLFQPSEKIPFSLYNVVATMPKEERKQFLEQADDGDFSIEKARVERKKAEGKQIRPNFRVEFCDRHQKWMFVPEDPTQWEANHEYTRNVITATGDADGYDENLD